MARDFTKAREKARKAADAAVGGRLDEITQQAKDLEKIFDDLKLTDRETYDELIRIVEDATNRNESVASVVERVKALGAAGATLAGQIAGIASGGGGLKAVRSALGLFG